MTMRQAVFVGRALDEIRAFPENARHDAGYQIQRLQQGEAPDDWKPLKGVGRGVREIRIWEANGTFRVVYVATIDDDVYVLHAFQKKTEKTPTANLKIAQRRFRDLVQELKNG